MGYATTSYDPKEGKPVIGFDMGGTSTDVSRFDGEYKHVYDAEIAGIPIQVRRMEIDLRNYLNLVYRSIGAAIGYTYRGSGRRISTLLPIGTFCCWT